MQGFNFGLRRPSVADSLDGTDSRYVPSSIYSGAPNESRAPSVAAQFTPMAFQGPYQEDQPRYNPVSLVGRCRDGTLMVAVESRTSSQLRPLEHPRPGCDALTYGDCDQRQ